MTQASKCLTLIFSLFLLAGCAQSPTQSTGTYESPVSTRDSGDVESARAHTELASEYFRLGRFDVALEEFTIAAQKSPSYALAYNGLGLVYAALGEQLKADGAFKRALQLQPNSSESHNNYGRFLCDQGKYDDSIQQFLLAVKNPLYSTPQIAYHNAGVCALRNQQKQQAETYLIKALTIDPMSHATAYQLANLQYGRGEPALAWRTLQKSVNMAPTAESLMLAIRLTEALRMQDDQQYFTIQLHKRYPNSIESRQLLKME